MADSRPRSAEIIFKVTEAVEGWYDARALGYSIYTQGENWDDLKEMARDAVLCHFDEDAAPRVIRLHLVREEAVAVRRGMKLMGGKKDMRDPRFVIEHAGDPEYSLVTRSSDGQMLFLANKLSKMKQDTRVRSRIAEVHNGNSLFTDDAGQGESNIRRWIIDNDWLERAE